VHIGNFDGKTKPRGNRLAFGDGYDGSAPPDRNDPTDCRVLLRLVGPYLVAADNQGCGGANVSFDGVYTKAGG
jgi:hypothetical protein